MDSGRLKKAKWLWLADGLGCASAAAGKILRRVDDIDRLFAILHDGEEPPEGIDWDITLRPERVKALRTKRPADFFARLDECGEKGIEVVTWGEPEYPELLRQLETPPPVLYYRGDITIPNNSFLVAIIGARRPSAYGMEVTQVIAGELARSGVVLVSGLAAGLDGECHKAALNENAETVACLAFGVDQCYPAENARLKTAVEQSGLVLSEYPPGTPPLRQHFLQRNRLIAGLSHGVCVAEARRRSGTMSTVDAAVEAGRDVFSVPGNIFSPLSEGTNYLLVEGAHAVRCGGDILFFYKEEIRRFLAESGEAEETGGTESPDAAERMSRAEGPAWDGAVHEERQPETGRNGRLADSIESEVPLSTAARALRKVLRVREGQKLDALCEKLDLPYSQVAAAASELEFAGIAVRSGAGQYTLKP